MNTYTCSLNRFFQKDVTAEMIGAKDATHAAVEFYRKSPLKPMPVKIWVKDGDKTLVVEVTPVGRILQGVI
jgi:hypothetical protein